MTSRFKPFKHTVIHSLLNDLTEVWWGIEVDEQTAMGVTESQEEIKEICKYLNTLDISADEGIAMAYSKCFNIAKKHPNSRD